MTNIEKLNQILFYIAIGIIVFILTFITHSPDYDFWARLAVGSIFFQTGWVPHHDIFSYVPTKAQWIDHEWGASVIFYGAAKFLGVWGFFLLKAVIIFLVLLFIIKIIRMHKETGSVGIVYIMLTEFSLFPGVGAVIRCQMFTYLFFALWLFQLENIRKNGNKNLWIFPVTMLFWVNMHGGFIAGIGLLVIYAIGELLNRKNPYKYLIILGMILPFTLINPYGVNFWKYIIEATLMSRPTVPEWYPIRLDGPNQIIMGFKVHYLIGFFMFVVLTAIAFLRQILQKEKLDWTKYLLATTLLYIGCSHQRHIIFFVIAMSALFYNQYILLLNFVKSIIAKLLKIKNNKLLNVINFSLGHVLLLILLFRIFPFLHFDIILNPKEYPYGSFEFIRQNKLSGSLATTFKWSSYAFWKLYPQCKVLVDGRYEEVYTNTVFNEAIQISLKTGNWDDVIRKYNTDILVLPKQLFQP
ncbi:MAG TPA: hypothetical protein VHO70_11300, partial [Chitinispirillaceae bacterium]|nr:hypothetical protein [Chitinispirillaceae bacterium]